MKAAFLEKYYHDSRHNHAKKAITSPKQDPSESLYEYWERFKKLVAQCPYHGLSGDDLLANFCDGLTQQYQIMVNSATGGGVDNYSVAEANEIIERLAASTRNYGRTQGSKTINSIETPSSSNNKLEKTVDELTKMVSQLVGNNQGGAQGSNLECNYCHGPQQMETCPIMEEQGISKENVSAMMHGQYNSRNPNGVGYYEYDPSGNTYNIGSRDNPNISWGGDTSRIFQNGQLNHLRNSNSQGQSTNYQRNNNLQQAKGGSFHFGNQGNHKNFQGGGSSSQGDEELSNKKMFKMLMKGQTETIKRFDKIDVDKVSSDARVKNIEIQLGQLAQQMAKNNQRKSNSIPSTTFPPKENVSAMTLRKGITLESSPKKKRKAKSHERVINIEEQIGEELVIGQEKGTPSKANGEEEKTPLRKDKGKKESTNTKDQIEEIKREKCEVNIPLFTIIKPVRSVMIRAYANYIVLNWRQSFARAMLDSGSSINVMPYSVYETLELSPLSMTNIVIQLADRSTIQPKGLVEDVLVEVDKFMFPADFYVLDMEPDSKATPLFLGRPFMRTSKTKLDMYDGNLTMEFEGKIVRYNVYETIKNTDDFSFCYFFDESIEALEEEELLEEVKEEEEIKEIEEKLPSKDAAYATLCSLRSF
ncbi:uncharacterized protein LOC141629376 [Silene latifolia]|uniref:uncharacterized protein LOC141629376 n=1 Tax=Silene latifolia TaxID=37657 RepID=UPI003D76D96C